MNAYVQVAVPVPLRQLYTYSVPDGLVVEPGLRVRVRFGPRKLVALVISGPASSLSPGLSPERVRPLESVLDDSPVLPPDVMALAQWLVDYYHAAPGEVFLAMTPPQVSGGRRGTVIAHAYRREYVATFVSDPAESQRIGPRMDSVLSWLKTSGGATAADVRDATGGDLAVLRRLAARHLITLTQRDVPRDPFAREPMIPDVAPPLMEAQKIAVRAVMQALGDYEGFLLRGVTGSGKTEVYLALIARVLESGQGAIVLVPEIGLTPQLVSRFRNRFGERIAVLHSGLAPAERYEQWVRIRSGELPIVIGARSALFAPMPSLGLVVVDEAHDHSFKQETTPRYHARDLALVRGRIVGCPVLLGSATPSLESWTNVRAGKLRELVLAERVHTRPMPSVDIVDLKEVSGKDPEGLISTPLHEALTEVLTREQQAIIFLNRRGFAASMLCSVCGEGLSCPSCSVTYTWHRGRHRLVCHYCDRVASLPKRCLSCHADELIELGFGTERVEAVLSDLFPRARIGRMDRDTTRGRALHNLLGSFRRREIDLLIGTQMVAKGHDFPGVTLVGVLLAEQGLRVPDFRASERTFQLLTQIAGRAGRAEEPGRVLIQTYTPSHYALQFAVRHDTVGFLAEEDRRRRERGFPPGSYLALFRLTGTRREGVEAEAAALAEALAKTSSQVLGEARGALLISGPRVAPIERIKERWRYHVLLNARTRGVLHRVLHAGRELLDVRRRGVSVVLDVDPISFL